MNKFLSERTVSSYAVSIGTAMALETFGMGQRPAYDPERQVQHMPLSKYQEFWINLVTLFRNMVSSVKSEHRDQLKPEDLADCLAEELDVIDAAIAALSGGATRVVYYTCGYTAMKNAFQHAELRVDRTENQRQYTELATKTINAFYKKYKHLRVHRHFSTMISPNAKTKAVMLSHYAVDLLSWKMFANLELLESHTGRIKPRTEWYTKYVNGKERCVRIPWDRRMLQVFGDQHTFSPLKKAVIDAVLAVAEEHQWTQATTDDRIRLGIGSMKDKYAAAILASMK